MPDKRTQIYNNLIGSGRVSESEIGTLEDFQASIKDEATARQFYNNLIRSGVFTDDELGSEDDFYGSIGSDFAAVKPAAEPRGTESRGETGSGRVAGETDSGVADGGVAGIMGAVGNTLAGSRATRQRVQNMMGRMSNPLSVQRVALGAADEGKPLLTSRRGVTKGREYFDPKSGKMKSSYVTEAGNEYDSRALADIEQGDIDEARYEAMHPIEARLKALYEQRDEIDAKLKELGEAEDAKHDTFLHRMAAGMNVTGGLGYGEELARQRNTNPEYQRWQAAADQNEKAIRDLEAVRDKASAGVWRGFADTFNKDNWDQGFSRANTAAALAFLAADLQKGEEVDAAGEALLENTMEAQDAERLADKEMGDGYRFAKIGGTSLPFAADLLMGYGMIKGIVGTGTKLGVKAGTKFATRELSKKMLKYTGTGLGEIAASYAVANTVQGLKTGADITNRYLGRVDVDEDGDFVFTDGESLGKAFIKGENAAMVENFTEMLGEHIPGVGDMLTKGLGKLGLKGASEWLMKVGEKDFVKAANKWLGRAGIQDLGSEILEEEINIPLNALLVGDNEISDLADWQTQKDILGGMVLSVGAMKGAALGISATGNGLSSAMYHRSKRKMEDADALAGFRLTKEKWEPLRDRIDGADNENLMDVVTAIVNDESLADQEKEAVVNYVNRLLYFRGYNLGQSAAERNGGMSGIEASANDAYSEGYNMEEPEEKAEAKAVYEAQRERMAQLLGTNTEDVDDAIGAPMEYVGRLLENGMEEEVQPVLDYLNAKAVYDGMTGRVGDDIDSRIAAVDAELAAQTKQTESGEKVVQTATLKEGDRQVHVISGDIVMFDDGTMVDTAKSSDTVVVRDAETGKLEMVAPSAVLSVDEGVPVEQLRAEAETRIREELTAQAEAEMNGLITEYNEGDTYNIYDEEGNAVGEVVLTENADGVIDNGDGTVNVLLPSGEMSVVRKDELQRSVDMERQARAAARVAGETGRGITGDGNNEGENIPASYIGRSLSAEESDAVIAKMEETAEAAPELELTPENWIAEFGEDGKVETPIGQVKMGENQLAKLFMKGRQSYFGMIKPTLTTPDIVLEKHAPQEGAERDTKLVFVKTFIKPDGSRVVHFQSVTVKKDGMEVSISSHEAEGKDIKKDVQNCKILHISDKLPLSSEWSLTETPQERPDLVPTSGNIISAGKGTEMGGDVQGNGGENALGVQKIPVAEKKTAMYEKDEPLFSSVPVEATIANLYGDGELDTNEVTQIVDAYIKKAEKNLKTLQGKTPKVTANVTAYKEAKRRYAADLAEAEREVEYWNAVKVENERVTQAGSNGLGETIAENGTLDMEPKNGEELASVLLREIKLQPDTDTNLRAWSDKKRMVGLWAKKENGGLTMDQAAERLVVMDEEEFNGHFFNGDTTEAKNALMDVLSSASTMADINNYVRVREEERMKREADYLEGQYRSDMEKAYNMPYDDYVAWEETAIPRIIERWRDVDYEKYTNFVAEEYEKREEYERANENGAGLADTSGREDNDRDADGGDAVLHTEQAGDKGGVPEGQGVGQDGRVRSEVPAADAESGAGEGGEVVEHAAEPRGTDDAGRVGGETDRGVTAQEAQRDATLEAEAAEERRVLADAIAEAEQQVNTAPTEAQKEAGNYKKGHVKVDGFDVTIEQPKGSVRSGKDANGREWSQTMNNTYGYIRGTEGVDGDHIDVFLSSFPELGDIFVIDQYNEDGSFDEHKVMYGYRDAESAMRDYLANYEKGWDKKRRLDITGVTHDDFKKWIDSSHRKTKPFAEYKSVKTIESPATEAQGTGEDYDYIAPEDADVDRLEQEWDDRIADYLYEHYPTQATVSGESKTEKGRREREAMDNDPVLQKMLADKETEVRAALEKADAARRNRAEQEAATAAESHGTEAEASWPKEQFTQFKAKHPDALFLFKDGDRYVAYGEDTDKLSSILGNGAVKRAGNRVYFPANALDVYLPKLVRAKQRVAIAEALDAPQTQGQTHEVVEDIKPRVQYRFVDENGRFEPTEEQRLAGEAVVDLLKGAGIEVSMDAEEMRKVLEASAGRVQEMAVEEASARFDKQLEGLTEENANNIRLELGHPSAILLSAGVADKPMLLYGNKVIKKAKSHGFSPTDIKGLVKAMQNPIAVFDGSVKDSFAVLTEMQIGDKNVLVSILTNKKGEVDFNIISSVYGKSSDNVIKWINSGKLRYADKEKALEYVSASAPIADATHNPKADSKTLIGQLQTIPADVDYLDLDSAAKVVESFENPKVSDEILQKMTVWHGSPYSFEAFDHANMGKGEGAQAHGWGTYVAKDRKTGMSYAGVVQKIQGESKAYFRGKTNAELSIDDPVEFAASAVLDELERGNYIDEAFSLARTALLKNIAWYRQKGEKLKAMVDFINEAYNKSFYLNKNDFSFDTKRNLYEVEIPEDDGTNYLDEGEIVDDGELERIKGGLLKNEAFNDYALDKIEQYQEEGNIDGRALYGIIQKWGFDGDAEATSKALAGLGYKGIKYDGRQDGECYVIFDEKDARIKNHVQFMKTRDGGVVYGFVKDGRVYIDPAKLNPETPIHEYSHLWDNAVREANPELWSKGVELMKEFDGGRLWDEVKNDPNYADIAHDENLIASEVKARLTGERGAEYFERAAKEAMKAGRVGGETAKGLTSFEEQEKRFAVIALVKQWLKDAWKATKEWLKKSAFARNWSKEDLERLTAEDFADMTLRDLTEGRNLKEEGREVIEDSSMGNREVGEDGIREGEDLFDYAERVAKEYMEKRKQEKESASNVLSLDEWRGRDVTADDYHIMTTADFKDISEYKGETNRKKSESVGEQWMSMKSSGKYGEPYVSPSGSQYLVDKEKGVVYRFANHWGDVSSCIWTLDGKRGNRQYRTPYGIKEMPAIGRCKIEDFSRDEIKGWQAEAYMKRRYGAPQKGLLLRGGKLADSAAEDENQNMVGTSSQEAEIFRFLSKGNTVCRLSGNEFKPVDGVSLTSQVSDYFKSIGGVAHSPIFGDVTLDKKGADDSLAHGMGRLKAIAYAAVKEVIEDGSLIESDVNHKGRGYSTHVVAAPIDIAGERYICTVIIKQNKQGCSFYLHEVYKQKVLEECGSNPAQKQAVIQRGGAKVLKYFELSEGNGEKVAFPATESRGMEATALFTTRKLKEGEKSYVERKFRETKQFSFTAGEKLESADDVAFIFKELEEAAVENSFAVLVKDGQPTILHLGMGTFTNTHVNIPALKVAYERVKPDKVYFVHNHPSGTLRPSREDYSVGYEIGRSLGVEPRGLESIIIDTLSGKYSTFDPLARTYDVRDEKTMTEGEHEVKVYSFDKQVFDKDYDPESVPMLSGAQIAAFVSSQRLGKRDKVNFLVFNNGMQLTANMFTTSTKIPKDVRKLADRIAHDAITFGGTAVVVYGSGIDQTSENYEALQRRLGEMGVKMVDAIGVQENGGYFSCREEGMLGEPEVTYGGEANDGVKRERVERLSERYGVKPVVVEDAEGVKELEEYKSADAETKERMLRSKGWFDPKTGEVVVVLGNNADAEDVAATIFHEVTAHKGLREIIAGLNGVEAGTKAAEDAYSDFCMDVYGRLDKETRDRVHEKMGENGWRADKAVDELFGELADKNPEDFTDKEMSLWKRLKARVTTFINKMLGALGLPKWVALGDNELRYMLWRSHKNLQRGKEDVIEQAQDIVKRDDLKLGNAYDINKKESRSPQLQASKNAQAYRNEKLESNPTRLQTPNDVQAVQRGELSGTKVTINSENRKKIEENLSELANKVSGKHLLPEDFLSELRKSMLTESEDHSGYNEMEIDGGKYTLRVSDHHANAKHNKQSKQFKVTSIVIKTDYSVNRFRAHKDVEVVEYVFDSDKLSQQNEQDVVKGLQEWLKTGVCEIEGATRVHRSPKGSDDILFRDGDEPTEAERLSDIMKDMSLGMEERRTAAAARMSEWNADDKRLKQDVVTQIGRNLADLRRAMSAQKRFDQSTVKRVADLYRVLMASGYLKGMTQGEMKSMLSNIKASVGREDITPNVTKAMDTMTDCMLRNAKGSLEQLLTIKGSKVDAKGVEVQGALDPDGARTMQVFKKTYTLPEEDINQRIAEAVDRMGSTDSTVADEAAIEYAGLTLAQEYAQNIASSVAEEKGLRDELDAARKNRTERDAATDSWRQYVESMEDAIRENKTERIEAYYQLIGRMSDAMRESMANAADFRAAEKERVREIQHNANSDMEGRPSDEHHKTTWREKFVNNSFVQLGFAPLGTFDQMLRMFGSKSANGEGYLWNRFMRGWVDAREKEIEGVKDKYAILDAKAEEVLSRSNRGFIEGKSRGHHGEVKCWGDLIRLERKMPKASVSFWDGGEMKEHELTQGNMLYIYMANKMADGRMKLRKMGISEGDVNKLLQVLDPRFVELADWLQDEFLVDTRNEYNETHKRMFGASMAAIENYFPLKILANARADKPEDLDNPVAENGGISTTTGSIIKRRRNALALDITGADAFSVILDHVAQMEHWNAYAEWNRDLNTLRTYRRFRNQVQNMTSVYGGGKELWKKFNDVCQMAAGTYRPPRAKLDEAAVNFAKGVTAAKVSFRIFTALKQLLSMPAYLPEARPDHMLADLVNPIGAWKWSMENLPIFKERWASRMSGDPRLLKSDMDWKLWRSRIMEISSRFGMSPNAFVDALTVSIGAHSMYKTRKGQYISDGYSEEEADRRAKQDATILFNQTQQSSEGAFTSTMQVDRSWLSVLFTVFRNSSMSYTRQLYDAVRNMKRNLTPSQRAESIAFMAKQMERDGIDHAAAQSAAERRFNRSLLRDALRIGVFGYVMQLAWNLGAYLPYILFGDDDDEKQKMLDDVWAHSMFGSIEGLTGGDLMSQAGAMMVTGEGNPAYLTKDMPLASDITAALKKLGKDNEGALSDMINLVVQSGIGVNPQSITDGVLAIMDACGDDPELAHEATICVMRILQVPQSQIDRMYFDEVGLNGDEVSNYTPAQLAERYAHYKVKRGRLYAPWSWDDSEAIGKQSKKAESAIKERVTRAGNADVNDAYNAYVDGEEYKRLRDLERRYNKAMKEDYAKVAEIAAELYGDAEAYSRYYVFKEMDQTLDELSKAYLGAKSADEAARYRKAMSDYKASMIKAMYAMGEGE